MCKNIQVCLKMLSAKYLYKSYIFDIFVLEYVGPRRDLYFLNLFILFLHACMLPACCFRQRTYMSQSLVIWYSIFMYKQESITVKSHCVKFMSTVRMFAYSTDLYVSICIFTRSKHLRWKQSSGLQKITISLIYHIPCHLPTESQILGYLFTEVIPYLLAPPSDVFSTLLSLFSTDLLLSLQSFNFSWF